jgi:hypothetical protein
MPFAQNEGVEERVSDWPAIPGTGLKANRHMRQHDLRDII